jgi:hypothetical protein
MAARRGEVEGKGPHRRLAVLRAWHLRGPRPPGVQKTSCICSDCSERSLRILGRGSGYVIVGAANPTDASGLPSS